MSFNWDDVLDGEAGDAGLPPAGKYTVKVLSAEGKVAGSGNPMVNLKVAIVGGPFAGTEIYTNIVLSSNPKATKWMLRKLNAVGISRDYLAQHKPDQNAIAGLINQTLPTLEADVEITEYQDEKRNEIKSMRPIDGGAQAPSLPGTPAPGVPQTPSVSNIPTPPQSDTPMPGAPSAPF